MNRISFLLMLLVVAMLSACRAPQISYYQDAENGASMALPENGTVKLRPMDEVVVIVNAKDPQYVNMCVEV